MSDFKLEVKNMRRLREAFLKSPSKMSRGLQKAIRKSTAILQRESKDIIRTGRGYSKRPFDTGNLFRTIFTEIKPFEGRIFANADYAIYVHEGLSTSRRYGPRPFFTDAIEGKGQEINAVFIREINNALKLFSK